MFAHDWSSGCLATAYAIEKLLLQIFCNNGVSFRDSWRRIYRRIKRNFQANLEEYESDVLDQTLSHFNAFRNSVIFPSMLSTSNRNESS